MVESDKDKGLLEQFHEAEREQNEGKPWYVRHKESLLILGLTIGSAIFCIVWNHYFPNGIW